MALKMKIIYGLLITLALVIPSFSVVLADDVGWLPTWTSSPQPTKTDVPPPTPTDEPTPTSPPEYTPTASVIPLSEPTPTDAVDPTSTPERKKGKPSPTPDCINDYENNKDKCLAPTGVGDSILMLLFGAIGGLMLLGLILILRTKRNGGTLV